MPDPKTMSAEELVDFITNLSTGVANGKVPGFLAAQNTSISDALTDINAELAAANLGATTTMAAALEAKGTQSSLYASAQSMISDTKFGVRSVNSEPSVYEALGFDPPDTTRSSITPKAPTDLVAAPFAPGTNMLRWRGNNESRVTYIIEEKHGDTADWAMIGTSTSQKFRHTPVTSGEYYNYRVRAQGSRSQQSEWSNTAVCYGM
jgi:hypothetical protein